MARGEKRGTLGTGGSNNKNSTKTSLENREEKARSRAARRGVRWPEVGGFTIEFMLIA